MTVVWALTWLGQSAALAALTAVCVRLPGCRQSAATRHVAWLVTLLLCAGLLAVALVPAAPVAPSMRPAAGAQPSASAALVVLPAAATRMSWWLGWIWTVGAAAGLALVIRDVGRVVRLKCRAVPLSMDEQSRLGAGLALRMSRRAPHLAWCDRLSSPAVLGFSRPVIALPRSQVSSLSDAQSRFAVLHELAHVRRGDDWWALAERVILALTWVSPAVHWVRRELSLSREMACDEWVVKRTGAPVAYARCLAEVAALQAQGPQVRLAAGLTGRPGMLRRRIVGVLALDGRRPPRAAAVVAWMAPVAVCVVASGLLRLPPVIDVAHPPVAAVPAPARAGPSESADRASAGPPAGPLDATGTPAPARRAPAARRSSESRETPAVSIVTLESASPAPVVPEVETAQTEVVDLPPLAGSPVAGVGVPGLTAVPAAEESFSPPAGAARWWSGPAAFGASTGGAAATAGRATASFFARVGSRVPQLLKR